LDLVRDQLQQESRAVPRLPRRRHRFVCQFI